MIIMAQCQRWEIMALSNLRIELNRLLLLLEDHKIVEF